MNTPRPDYDDHVKQWQRCRDCREGSDAVKKRGRDYLPPLEGHREGPKAPERYAAYLQRAMFFNATSRTIQGLAGAIFQKPPVFTVPKTSEPDLADITLAGTSAEMFAMNVTEEVLTTGRNAILVDMPADATATSRPYWVDYEAEDIISWRVERKAGDEILTRVVLREMAEEADPKDPWVMTAVEQYRVLELTPGGAGLDVYTQTVYRKHEGEGINKGEWIPDAGVDPTTGVARAAKVTPMRRGQALDFIPFVFLGPTSTSPDIEKPPLLDLVDVNLSHYRTMADLENGLHFTGNPVLVVIGLPAPTPEQAGTVPAKQLEFGSGAAVSLPVGGDAKILQANGDMLGALEKAADRKRVGMATLGARLLEDAPARGVAPETATSVGMRHSGEHATLRTVAATIEQGLTMAVRIHCWWVGADVSPAKVTASVELNKEFFQVRAQSDEVLAAVTALQADAISFETFYDILQRGGWEREGVTYEQEQGDIQKAVAAADAKAADKANTAARNALDLAMAGGGPPKPAPGAPAVPPTKVAA